MKKTIALVLLITLISAMPLALSGCDTSPLPKGVYSCSYVDSELEFEFTDKIEIRDSGYCPVMIETDSFTAYKVYNYELNEDKTQITLTFVNFMYDGDANYANWWLTEYENSFGKPSSEPETKEIEIGKGYFVIDGKKFVKEK